MHRHLHHITLFMNAHSFHIPVMGLGYTIDTPLKVARFGISSVVSIIEDHLIEQMREIHCARENEEYVPIPERENDSRARRITAYLDLLDRIVKKQVSKMKEESFDEDNDLVKYFELLEDSSPIKKLYETMRNEKSVHAQLLMQRFLRENIFAGSIDVNIMTKCDKTKYDENGNAMPAEFSDAMAAFRGYAKSTLSSSIVFSAGLNPRLYSYCESFPDFFPDENGVTRKKIILKVSDYRSAFIQGKFFAKKGLWISEFRIESGLNCGGHAFATDGNLLGPVLNDFFSRKAELTNELASICKKALIEKGYPESILLPRLRITVQGGIGTPNENKFLIEHYNVDSTGWGSPFLLVPEATNVDQDTLNALANAKKEDYYLSTASPLGIPFNNFRKSSSEVQRKRRIERGRPGSPCYKKFLAFNTEFTEKPICTASRQYQDLKIKQLDEKNLEDKEYENELRQITDKDCLCEGLGAAAVIKNDATDKLRLTAVAICPGPNLAYFSGVFSLREMVDHIYGRTDLRNNVSRPHMFINELQMNVDYLEKENRNKQSDSSGKYERKLIEFKNNLLNGIEYYKSLLPDMKQETESFRLQMNVMFDTIKTGLERICIGPVTV